MCQPILTISILYNEKVDEPDDILISSGAVSFTSIIYRRKITMIYTLNDFIREYTRICDMGWIKTHRAGPTGIGKTLEDLLGIQETTLMAQILVITSLSHAVLTLIACLQFLQKHLNRKVQPTHYV